MSPLPEGDRQQHPLDATDRLLPDTESLTFSLGIPAAVSAQVLTRLPHKLAADPVEDLRADVEDAYGTREDHVNEPGRTQWEGFTSATVAAAAGGVTRMLDMPLNSIPPTCDLAAWAAERRSAAGQCHVDVGFWAGAIPGNCAELSARTTTSQR